MCVDWIVDWSGRWTVSGWVVLVLARTGALGVRKWPVAPVSRIRGLRVREVRVVHCGFVLCGITLL